MSLGAGLHIIGVAVLGFVSTSLDNLGVLTALVAARALPPWRLAAGYLGVTAIITGFGWAMAFLAELALAERIGTLGWIPIGLGIRAAWLLRRPLRETSGSASTLGALAVALLILATSADNLLISLSLFAHAPRTLEPLLFTTLVICSVAWFGLAFWLARRSPVARLLQRTVRPLLPLLLIAVGTYMLIEAGADTPNHRTGSTSRPNREHVQSVASRDFLRP